MKKTLLFLFGLFLTLSLQAQWDNTGINLTTTDKVGIGTSNPDEALVVNGNISFSYNNNLSSNGLRRNGIKTEYYNMITGVSANVIHEFTGTNTTIMSLTQGGQVGIGTSNPTEKLHVNGNVKGPGGESSIYGFKNIIGRTSDGILHLMAGTQNGPIFLNYNKTGNVYIANQGGNVGIGTLTPGSWKLAVNGNIRAKEIKVETGWSDFVFYDNYELPSLDEVEKQIKEKGHLKDIPSAEEVAENGIFLGEMDAKLLQKIEELTLYTIQQQKRLKSLDSKIEKLELENKQLKSVFKRLNQIEKLLPKKTQD